MFDRWRKRRRLLAEAVPLEAEARRRDLSWTGAVYSIGAILGAAGGSVGARYFAHEHAARYHDGTEALRAKARALREEAARLG